MNGSNIVAAVLGGSLLAGFAQLLLALISWYKTKNERPDMLLGRAERVLTMMDKALEERDERINHLEESANKKDAKLAAMELELRDLYAKYNELKHQLGT